MRCEGRSESTRIVANGIVYLGRMLDKIRLRAAGDLHPDLHQNLGIGFDKRCVDFLRVPYQELAKKLVDASGGARCPAVQNSWVLLKVDRHTPA